MTARTDAGRVLRWFRTAGAVLAITAATLIGLHDWADGVATHAVVQQDVTSQDSTGS
jgi:hypothetical protein